MEKFMASNLKFDLKKSLKFGLLHKVSMRNNHGLTIMHELINRKCKWVIASVWSIQNGVRPKSVWTLRACLGV